MEHKRVVGGVVMSVLTAGFVLGACGSGDAETATGSEADSDNVAGLEELAEAQGDLTEIIESGSLGTGAGLITIDGVDYAYDADICQYEESRLEASGFGETADGVPYLASISQVIESRQQMESIGLTKDQIDAFMGDKDFLNMLTVDVELGVDSRFEGGEDGLAHFSGLFIDETDPTQAEYVLDGDTLSGTAALTDYNGVAVEFGEVAQAEFSTTCN